MGLADWLEEFRLLHEQARKGAVNEVDQRLYTEGRDQLASALITAQRLTLDPSLPARHSLRVARAMQVDLEVGRAPQRATTLDISMTGFSAMLGRALDADEAGSATVKMPGGVPLVATARVVAARKQGPTWRVSFEFIGLPAHEAERLSDVVFDVALAMLQRRG